MSHSHEMFLIGLLLNIQIAILFFSFSIKVFALFNNRIMILKIEKIFQIQKTVRNQTIFAINLHNW